MVNDVGQIREKAAAWMISRGWRRKLAKKLGREQTLFEHTLVELDVLLELLPILSSPQHYNLTDREQRILQVAVVVHDVGKERDEWQDYVCDSTLNSWVPHIVPELTRSVVAELCAILGFERLDEPVEQIMARCADLHHARPGRVDGSIISVVLSTSPIDRFLALADIVKAVDHCCSAASSDEAKKAFDSEPALRNHVRVAIHEASVRGVSTVFVHAAAQAAFSEQGWRILLYYTNATVYGSDPNEHAAVPTGDAVGAHLKRAIDEAIAHDVTSLMVGSPTGNILPKPDLFAFSESRKYLEIAGRKIGPKSFSRKSLKVKRRVIEQYWKLKGQHVTPTDQDVEREGERISSAQPEMMVFKFFKAMTDRDKIAAVGEDGSAKARSLYEDVFGAGSWAALQSTSTLMPAKDMTNTVEYFWALSGAAVKHPEVEKAAELPQEARLQALIGLLGEIADKTYRSIPRPSPRDELSTRMTESFLVDIVKPAAKGDVVVLAQTQLDYYLRSKPFAGKQSPKGTYLCPICNVSFNSDNGRKASADFIDNPQTHTNRGIAHGSFGYITICAACYYERLLRQVLLGSRPAEIISLAPRFNLGPGKGEFLVRKVREWVELAREQMRGEIGNLESGFSLSFTDQAANRLADRDPLALGAEDLFSVFSFRFREETMKDRKREALKRLKEEFDEDLASLNDLCSESFPDWEAAVQALIDNRMRQQEIQGIRREVFRLYETVRLICETPNLIFIPLSYEVAAGQDESEANKALRSLYVALILSLVFDAAVAVHKENEQVDYRDVGGAAYVSPIPAVRSLIGYDWIPVEIASRWLAGIGAASLLARDTGFSPRSALFQVLAADPPEKLARRIEENRQNGGRQSSLTTNHVRWIERIIQARSKERS